VVTGLRIGSSLVVSLCDFICFFARLQSQLVLTRPHSNSALSTEVSSSSLGLDMFRSFIQTDGGILPKLGYGHNHKYSLNHNSQSVLIFIQHRMGISNFIS